MRKTIECLYFEYKTKLELVEILVILKGCYNLELISFKEYTGQLNILETIIDNDFIMKHKNSVIIEPNGVCFGKDFKDGIYNSEGENYKYIKKDIEALRLKDANLFLSEI